MSIISNEEVIELFKQVNPENEKESKEIKNKIVCSLSFLVYKIAKPYSRFPNYEDLVQEGFIGLIRAVNKYNYKLYPNFFIYASQWIKNNIKKSAKKFDVVYNPNRKKVIYSSNINEQEIDPISFEDTFFANESKRKIIENMEKLDTREREIIKMTFGIETRPQTLRQIGKKLNITHERVRQIKNDILSNLKENQSLNELNN